MQKKENIFDNYFFKQAESSADMIKKIEQVSQKEINDSWTIVQKTLTDSYQNKTRTKRRNYYTIFTAAAVTLLILISVFYKASPKSDNKSLIATLQDNNNEKSIETEIALITSNSHLELKDNSSLDYNSDGKVSINKQQVNVTQKTNSNNNQEFNCIIVPKGRRLNVTFEDGTKMCINACSKVAYPVKFNKIKREIAIEGEAYLEVAHDSKRPFIVKTGKFDVKVLGTTFNVTAYKNETSASVVLVDGSVEIETTNKEKVLISPNQRAYVSNEKITTDKVNVFKYICWKDNLMYLKYDQISYVLDRLSKFYGIVINYDDAVAKIPISGKLDLQNNIQSVLDVIEESVPVKVTYNNKGEYCVSLK